MKLFISIVLLLVGVYACFWYSYHRALKEQGKRWYKEEYIEKSINGKVKSIWRYYEDPFQVVVSIKNENDEYDTSYGLTCVDEDFISFVAVGDSVSKMQGEKTIQFCKKQGLCKDFELNFCGEFDD